MNSKSDPGQLLVATHIYHANIYFFMQNNESEECLSWLFWQNKQVLHTYNNLIFLFDVKTGLH